MYHLIRYMTPQEARDTFYQQGGFYDYPTGDISILTSDFYAKSRDS